MRTRTRRVRFVNGRTERLYRVYLGVSDAYMLRWVAAVTVPDLVGYSHAEKLTAAIACQSRVDLPYLNYQPE